MNKKKVGFIGVDEDLIYVLRCKIQNVVFRNVRKSKHKIYDVVIHTDTLTKEEKTMYELFNVILINISHLAQNEIADLIVKGLNKKRNLSNKQIKYINVINNFQYLNERVEKIVNQSHSHSLSVAYKIKKYADSIYINKDRLLDVYMAALMHDIGKIFINPRILSKKEELTNIEYQSMKSHPIKGYELLKNCLPELSLCMIRNHHKRENNTGYPNDGVEIDNWTRLLSLCDSLDAMTCKRIYNTVISIDDGLKELLMCTKSNDEGGKGKIFDGFLTKSFINVIKSDFMI